MTARSIGNIFLGVALMSLLAFGTFGMLNMGMDMQMDGSMSPCPFSVGTSVCTMTPLAHLAASQSFFTTLVTYGDVLTLLALLAFAIYASAVFWKPHAPPLVFAYARIRRREFMPRSHLQEAFSNGILNPKVF